MGKKLLNFPLMIDLTGVEMAEIRTENGQRRRGSFALWTVERAWNFECCGITIHVYLSGSYGRSARLGIFVAAIIIQFHCGDRQRQVGDGLTEVRQLLCGYSDDDRRSSPRHSNMDRRAQKGLSDLQIGSNSRIYRLL